MGLLAEAAVCTAAAVAAPHLGKAVSGFGLMSLIGAHSKTLAAAVVQAAAFGDLQAREPG